MPNEFTLFSVAESPDAKGHGSSLRTVIIASSVTAVVVFLVGTLSWIIYKCRKKGVSSSWLFHPMTTNYSISVNGNYIFFFFFFFRMKKNLTLIVIKCCIRSVFSRAAFVFVVADDEIYANIPKGRNTDATTRHTAKTVEDMRVWPQLQGGSC